MRTWYCLECWEQFDEETVGHRDDGIGSYEYWGAKGVDRHIVECCPHCEDDVTEGSLPSCDGCGEPLTKQEHTRGVHCTSCNEDWNYEASEADEVIEAEDQ